MISGEHVLWLAAIRCGAARAEREAWFERMRESFRYAGPGSPRMHAVIRNLIS